MADEHPGQSNSALFRDVANKLRDFKHPCNRIYRVYSAGESGTGDTTVLYVDFALRPKTAFLGCERLVVAGGAEDEDPKYKIVCVVVDGWDVI